MRHTLSIASFAALMLAMGACNNKTLEAGTQKRKDTGAGAGNSDLTGGTGDAGADDGTPFDPKDALGPNANVINVKYNITASAIGIKVCTGKAQFKIRVDVEKDGKLFDLPYAKLKCLGGLLGEFDLTKALGGLAGSEKDYTGVSVKDAVIRLKGFGPTVYQKPWRPFLPSFLSGKPDELRALNISEPILAKDSKTLEVFDGTVSMRTISFGDPYSPPDMPDVTLPKTMRFVTENKGFKGMEKLGAVLFDRMEMVISLTPVAIPTLLLETKMKDVMKAAANMPDAPKVGGGLMGLLVGWVKVKIAIQMFDQQGLRKFLEQEAATHVDGADSESSSDGEDE